MYAARGLHVRIKGKPVLREIEIAIRPGEITVVVGPNGAGKSTLLRAMAGEQRIAAGTVEIDGRDVTKMTARALASRRAVLAQSTAMASPFAVADVVRLGIPAHVLRAEADGHVTCALAAVGMGAFADRPVTQLSGGEQQRVHMARVLAQLWSQGGDQPRYLLLDEPTSHLDPAHQAELARLARAHAKAGGGVLAILHDLNLAAAIADVVAVMRDGEMLAEGAPNAVLSPGVLQDAYGVRFEIFNDHGCRRLWHAL